MNRPALHNSNDTDGRPSHDAILKKSASGLSLGD